MIRRILIKIALKAVENASILGHFLGHFGHRLVFRSFLDAPFVNTTYNNTPLDPLKSYYYHDERKISEKTLKRPI